MHTNYHLQNRLGTYKLFTSVCMAVLLIAGMLTVWIVSSSYQRFKQAQTHTYVYSRNGAAIHVFIEKTN